MAWLMAEGDTPRRFPARVKLRSSATVSRTVRSLRSSLFICEFYSQLFADCPDLSFGCFALTLQVDETMEDFQT